MESSRYLSKDINNQKYAPVLGLWGLGTYASQKYKAMSKEDKKNLMKSVKIIQAKCPLIGWSGALELLLSLGTWINEAESYD